MEKLLVPIDFSNVSDAVLEHAESLAQAFSANLILIHVAAPDPDFVSFDAGPQTVRDTRAGELRREHVELQRTAERLREGGIETKALLLQGPTVETILHEAEKVGADAIVIGSHGHSALYRALLGSVSEGILRGARCPVLVVPACPAKER